MWYNLKRDYYRRQGRSRVKYTFQFFIIKVSLPSSHRSRGQVWSLSGNSDEFFSIDYNHWNKNTCVWHDKDSSPLTCLFPLSVFLAENLRDWCQLYGSPYLKEVTSRTKGTKPQPLEKIYSTYLPGRLATEEALNGFNPRSVIFTFFSFPADEVKLNVAIALNGINDVFSWVS